MANAFRTNSLPINNMRRLSILLASIALFSCGDNKRTQEPKEPLPYESKEVNFKSLKGEVTLSGTLTTPTHDSLKTAVVLISGSGPDDRDYKNQFGHRPFLVLSHYLTQKGITVLRYDERGVGKSEGNYGVATYEDLVSDVAGGINYLRDIGFQKVGLIGHSEGGGIAPVASLQAKTDFLVLMAADNATADKNLIYQTGTQLKNMGVKENTSREIIETVDSLLAIVKSESDISIAKTKMENVIVQKNQSATEDYKETTQRLGDANRLIEGFLDPKFFYRLRNDPKDSFKKIRIPVLVLYGDDDGAVDITTNLPLIENAFDSTQYEIKIFPGLGHLFMNAKGVPMEKLYAIDETIAPEVLTTISDWIFLR
jgi:uncharacterized protein